MNSSFRGLKKALKVINIFKIYLKKRIFCFCVWIQHDAVPISQCSLFRFFIFWGNFFIIYFFLSRYSFFQYHICYVLICI